LYSTRAKFINLLSLFTPSAHLDFDLHWFRLPSGTAYTGPFLLLYRLLFLGHISCGEPFSQRRVIGSFSFLSAPMFHYRIAGPGGSRSSRLLSLPNVPCEMTSDVFAGRRSSYLQFGFSAVFPNPRSLVSQEFQSTKIRWRLRNSCRQKPQCRELSYLFSFVSWSSALFLLLLPLAF
jgi:hypothetical protein